MPSLRSDDDDDDDVDVSAAPPDNADERAIELNVANLQANLEQLQMGVSAAKAPDSSVPVPNLPAFAPEGAIAIEAPASPTKAGPVDLSAALSPAKPPSSEKRPPPPQCPRKPPCANPDWRAVQLRRPSYLTNGDGEQEWVWWYYAHKKTGDTSYFPPPPPLATDNEEDGEDEPAAIDLTGDKTNADKDGNQPIAQYFYRPPPKKAYSDDAQVADVADSVEGSDEEMMDPKAEPTIHDLIFTADKPVFLRMDETKGLDKSLVHKARQLGVYVSKMKRADIAKAIEKYWIAEAGGYDEYMQARIFLQGEQAISRKRKVLASAKRKQSFAESQTETKKVCRKHKYALSPSVSTHAVIVFLCSFEQ